MSQVQLATQLKYQRMLPQPGTDTMPGQKGYLFAEGRLILQSKPDKFWCKEGKTIHCRYLSKIDLLGTEIVGDDQRLSLHCHFFNGSGYKKEKRGNQQPCRYILYPSEIVAFGTKKDITPTDAKPDNPEKKHNIFIKKGKR